MTQQEKIMSFFKELSAIPRASGDEKQISDYLLSFAKDRNLWADRDDSYNVIIKKPATIKNCKRQGVILQGHMDMVYLQAPNSDREYKDGIKVLEKDGIIYADKTTLGADNGVAVAYILTLLDSNDILHPDIEAVITTQEEVGLVGAQKLSYDKLSGRYMINLDAENEGSFVTSCAGGVRCSFDIPIKYQNTLEEQTLDISITGLKGGHSGLDIDIGRGNAIALMARLLKDIDEEYLQILKITCDGKANAIANSCNAKIAVPQKREKEILSKIKELEKVFSSEVANTDTVKIAVTKKTDGIKALDKASKDRVLAALRLLPCGVQGKSFAIEKLVETSINIGAVTQEENQLSVLLSIRSNVASRKQQLKNTLEALAELVGAKTKFFSDYPQWEYNPSSKLRDIVGKAYQEKFNKPPTFCAIHAGLECGYFAQKLTNIDIISFGADMFDVHTVQERASVQSIYNVWALLVEVLGKLGG